MTDKGQKTKMIMGIITGILMLVLGIIFAIVILVTYGRQGPGSYSISGNEDPLAFAGVCVSGIIALVGFIVIIISAVMSRPARPMQYPGYGQYPPQYPYPQQHPQQQIKQQSQNYPCMYCHQPLTFIPQYQRWYCDNCRRYV